MILYYNVARAQGKKNSKEPLPLGRRGNTVGSRAQAAGAQEPGPEVVSLYKKKNKNRTYPIRMHTAAELQCHSTAQCGGQPAGGQANPGLLCWRWSVEAPAPRP